MSGVDRSFLASASASSPLRLAVTPLLYAALAVTPLQSTAVGSYVFAVVQVPRQRMPVLLHAKDAGTVLRGTLWDGRGGGLGCSPWPDPQRAILFRPSRTPTHHTSTDQRPICQGAQTETPTPCGRQMCVGKQDGEISLPPLSQHIQCIPG